MSSDERPLLPTAEDLAAFERDGFVVLRNALPVELIEPLHEAALRLRAAAPVSCSYRGNGKLGFRTLVSHDQAFLPLVANPRVLPTIVALLSPNIRMLSSHLITYDPWNLDNPLNTSTDSPRPAGGQHWHRDDVFHIQGDLGFAAVPRLTVHCAYYLSDIDGNGGTPTRFLPGSHRLSEPLKLAHDQDPYGAVVPEMQPNDVVLFENRTWHAPGSRGGEPRVTVMNQYGYRWLFPIDDPYDDLLRRSDLSGVERALLGQPDRNPDGSMAKRAGAQPLLEWWRSLQM